MQRGSQAIRSQIREAVRTVPDRARRVSARRRTAPLDLLEQERVQDALLIERNAYKDLTASLPVGVYRLRIQATKVWVHHEWVTRLGTNYTIEMANDVFCRILGITQAQRKANATIVAERIHPDDRQDFIAKNVEALNTLTTFRWAGRIVRGKKVRRINFVSVPRILFNGDMLWTGVLQDTTERDLAEAQLRQLNEDLEAAVNERTERLRSLAVELTQAEHRERRRIAHVLHEDLQQRLVGIQYQLHSLKGSGTPGSDGQVLDKAIKELVGTIQLARALATQISPPVLSALGFRPALDWLAKEVQGKCGLAVRVSGCRPEKLASEAIQNFAFDAIRELLLNICKHATVRSARIHLRFAGKDQLAIAVSDSGKGGARIPQKHQNFGLLSIRERAYALGVGFDLVSPRGRGTCVTLLLPTLGNGPA